MTSTSTPMSTPPRPTEADTASPGFAPERVARYRRDGLWEATPLPELLRRGMARRPEHLALVSPEVRWSNRELDERSDAFLVLPGGIGTLEEMFEMWTSRVLGVHVRPVVVLDPDAFFDGLWTFLDGVRDAGFVRQQALDVPVRARTVDDAFVALASSGS